MWLVNLEVLLAVDEARLQVGGWHSQHFSPCFVGHPSFNVLVTAQQASACVGCAKQTIRMPDRLFFLHCDRPGPYPLAAQAPPAHKDVGFADGAMVDNLGISALLRRGVKCMIVCAAVPAGPDDTWERYAEGMTMPHARFACRITVTVTWSRT